MKLAIIAALAATVLGTTGAQASRYAFSYIAVGGGVLAGQLTGTLQADRNTVLVDHVLDGITFNGVAGPALPTVITASTLYGVDRAPSVTFDGSIIDFFAITAPDDFLTGVLFDPDVVDFQPLASTSAEFGDLREDYRLGQWSLSVVPEPASWALMIAGFGLVGVAARRRAVPA